MYEGIAFLNDSHTAYALPQSPLMTTGESPPQRGDLAAARSCTAASAPRFSQRPHLDSYHKLEDPFLILCHPFIDGFKRNDRVHTPPPTQLSRSFFIWFSSGALIV